MTQRPVDDTPHEEDLEQIAIVGINARFPQSPDVAAFWENLRNGIEMTDEPTEADLDAAGVPQELRDSEDYLRVGAFIEDTAHFDANFFGLNPRDAAILDPQHRFFLEMCWHALEHAGYDPETAGKRLGVYAGCGNNFYIRHVFGDPELTAGVDGLQISIGNSVDHLAPRVSYMMNLRGPSVPVQTACSTSLVAVHLACQSLIAYESDMAMAGGVRLSVPIREGYRYVPDSIFSPTGHCHAFDHRAQGCIPGNGAGVVVLKRLEDAVEDGDHIHAVIRASAVNNDGSFKLGYTAPSVEGQRRVIKEALSMAALEPEDVTMIEAHGTGTTLGDPIEFDALTQAFQTDARNYCALGSLKSNMGHSDAAAGIAGLIKAVLCLENKTLVPSLNFEKPNPQIDLENSPFYVNTEAKAWDAPQRFVGISSFGIGGTNAHIILGEAPEPEERDGNTRPIQLATVSAKTEKALKQRCADLVDWLQNNPDAAPADVAHTLNAGRHDMAWRRALPFTDLADLATRLDGPGETNRVPARAPKLVFLFPGQGTKYEDLGGELYETEETFREEIDRCCEILKPALGLNLADVMYTNDARLNEPQFWQPALFVTSYAMARTYMSWGLHPESMMGHSVGEYVAAVLSGIFTLEDGLSLIAARGKGTAALEGGSMVAVVADEDTVTPMLTGRLALAAKNGPTLCVVSGPTGEIDVLVTKLEEAGVRHKRLTATHAFHSAMVEPLMPTLTKVAGGFEIGNPTIPMISNVTGTWMSTDDAADPQYWARHLRGTVRFNEGLETLLAAPGRVFLEVGPGKVLANLVRNHPLNEDGSFPQVSLGKQTGARAMAGVVAGLWRNGLTIKWKAYYQHEERARLVMPLYPFDRHVYWFNKTDAPAPALAASPQLPPASMDQRQNPADWYYTPSWQSKPLVPAPNLDALSETWLIFLDSKGRLARLADQLTELGQTVIRVKTGADWEAGDSYTIDIEQSRHLGRLAESLRDAGQKPTRVVYGLTMDATQCTPDDVPTVLNHTLDHQVHMAQSLNATFGDDHRVSISVVTGGMVSVAGESTAHAIQALSLGPVLTTPREMPNQQWRCIDLPVADGGVHETRRLLLELAGTDDTALIALRGTLRFQRGAEKLPTQNKAFTTPYREGGVYVLLNCWRDIAMTLAQTLILEADATLILVDRAFFPTAEEDQDAWLADQGPDDVVSERIEWVRTLEALGAQLHIVCADPGDPAALGKALQDASTQLGNIHTAFLFDHPDSLVLISERGPGFQAHNAVTSLREAITLCDLDDYYENAVIFGEHQAVGALGKVEQRAIYAFMGVLAEDAAARGKNIATVSWGTRAWRPMARAGLPQEALDYFAAERERFGMNHSECLEALARILTLGLTHTIVATRPYDALLSQQNALTLEKLQQQITEALAEVVVAGKPRPEMETPYVAPENEVETTLETIWKGFFGYEHIGRNDNFFDLGGHSLMATRVTSRIRDDLGVEMTLDALFNAPTIAQLADLVVADRDRDPAMKLPPITAGGSTGPERLSFAQQRLWFLDRFVEGDASRAAYNIFAPNEVEGELDPLILEQALGEVVRRHGSLRTTFHMEKDEPSQIIHPHRDFSLHTIDLRDLAPNIREAASKQIIEVQTATPFDLETGPLYRFILVMLEENHYHFHFTLHHTIGDGWSMGVLIGEMTTLYRAFSLGRPSPLPELPVQYIDFTQWQRGWEHGPYMEQHLDYWKHQLAGAPAMLHLPTDAPRTDVPSFAGAKYQFTISPQTTRKLEGLVKVSGATMFMVLQSVLTAMFRKYSGQDDIVLGSPIANRNYRETEPLIGFFVNTLVLRSRLTGDMTVTEHVDHTRKAALDGFSHQDVPFEYIVERVQPERNLTQSPLFQVMFALQNAPADAEMTPELIIRNIIPDAVSSIFDMTWNFHELGERGLLCSIDYNTSLYSEATLARFGRHFKALADGMASNHERTLDSFELLVSEEKALILDAWNQTELGVPENSVHLRVAALAASQGDHPAVIAENAAGDVDRLSYAALQTEAGKVTACLLDRNIGPEDRVAVLGERTTALTAAVLGTLGAGAAYMPLDPTYPPERLDYMLDDSGATLLLTIDMPAELPLTTAVPRLDMADVSASDAVAPPKATHPDTAAYVIYTSGTTGRPKGTVLHHGGLANLTQAQIDLFQLNADSRVLQFAALGFDASISEIFTTLGAGGTLVLAPREAMMPGIGLSGLMTRHQVNCVTLPPSAVSAMDDLPDLKTLVVAGEACPPDLAARWSRDRRFINAYGPTETTVCATAAVCTGHDRIPPIGAPIGNMQTYVVDQQCRPVPVGVPGELLVGGKGVGRGYLNKPALTAERFIPNPFSNKPGARLYRTGDLVCHRGIETCVLEFLGRIDHQVKLRGFRIELGEIEAALALHDQVEQAVAMVREDTPGDQRLVAYVVATGDDLSTALRNHLAGKLPDYMVPGDYVSLATFPLTPNGKIDRNALPAPDRKRNVADYVAPQTETQKSLAEMWQEVLNLDQVGLKDNFFELGGHSLLATKLVSRIDEAYNIELNLRDLFTLRTLGELAEHLDDVIMAAGLQQAEINEEEDREEMEF